MLKRLLSSVREYKKPSLLAPFFVGLESILEIIIPTLMALLIDEGISRGDMRKILLLGAALVGLAALSLVFGVLSGRYAALGATGFSKNLRQDMFYQVQELSFSNIDKFSTASVITRLTTDVSNVQNAYQMMIRLGVRSPTLMIFALIFAFRISPGLSMIFLAIIPFLGFGLWLVIQHVHPIFVRVFRTYDKLNGVVQENLLGIRVVKSYIREEHEQEKFAGISKAIYEDFTKAEKRLAINMPLFQFSLYLCVLLLSWFGAKEILASGNNPALGLSTGELASLITYAMQILMSLMMLSMVFVMIIIARTSAERIVELLDEESDLKSGETPVRDLADGAIRFENLRFSYSKTADKPVLEGINLSIASGETVGIIGGTGSAKSSLVQLIPRLYDATEGRVLVGGRDVRDYELHALRNQVAMVLQKNTLFSGTIRENLRWGKEDATDEELVYACRLACAHDFIMDFPDGYDTHIEQGGTNVSGGQRQRLCIARALLKRPKILILDDSTSAVDTKTDRQIRRAFQEEIPGTTKLIIAQRVASVQDADKIIVMDDGKISAVGTHAQLLEASEIYREVYESQTKGGALDEQ